MKDNIILDKGAVLYIFRKSWKMPGFNIRLIIIDSVSETTFLTNCNSFFDTLFTQVFVLGFKPSMILPMVSTVIGSKCKVQFGFLDM